MIWVVGGTSESRLVAEVLENHDYIITYATKDGLEFSDSHATLKETSSFEFAKDNEFDLIIDVTHPFAKNITRHVKDAANRLNIPYLRYEREVTEFPKEVLELSSFEECYEYLKTITGTVFFTTGSNNVPDFEKVKGNNRFVYRILPSVDSLKKVRETKVEMKDIVAMLGPFNEEVNMALLRAFNASYLVTKDSGKAGGTDEKITAALKLGIKPIVIARSEEGTSSFEEFILKIKEKLEEIY